MPRPKYATRVDAKSSSEVRRWLANHNCHPQSVGGSIGFYSGGYFAGLPIFAIDISRIGNWVDWLIWIGQPGHSVSCAWECKEKGKQKDLTPGEKAWKENSPTLFSIVTDEADCDRAAMEALNYLA